MADSFNKILFETKLPTEALLITTTNGYPVTVVQFFRGAYIETEAERANFKYPLMFAYRTERNAIEDDLDGVIYSKEQTVFIGIVSLSKYGDAEKNAELNAEALHKYLTPINNGIKSIHGSDGSTSKYKIISDKTFTLSSGNVFKSISLFELKITITN